MTMQRNGDHVPHHIRLSDGVLRVSFAWADNEPETTIEALVAAGRCYPGVRRNGRFFSGVRVHDRFLPGVVWAGRFVPGLVTRSAFVPGIAVGETFTPGVVVAGAFMPAVVVEHHLVPGIVSAGRFVPGGFTFGGGFVPGRFVAGEFRSGLLYQDEFEPFEDLPLPAAAAHALARQGCGLAAVTRGHRLGGLPIRGMVFGSLPDALVNVPLGLATSQGVVLGGLSAEGPLTTPDVDQQLGRYGFDIQSDDVGPLLGTDGLVERIETALEALLPGNSFGASAQSTIGELAGAMEGLGRGESALVDRLNEDWSDYWNSMLSAGAGGMVTGAESSTGGKIAGGAVWAVGGALGVAEAAEQGAALGAAGGPAVAVVAGFVAGLIALGLLAWKTMKDIDAGAKSGGKDSDKGGVEHVLERPGGAKGPQEQKRKKKTTQTVGGGTAQPGNDDTGGHEPTGHVGHPARPLGPYVSRRKTVIEIDHGEWGAIAGVDTAEAPVRIIHTDTGAVAVVNYDALREAIVSSANPRVVLALNPVTGSAVYLPGPVNLAEVFEWHKLPWWVEKKGHPLGPNEV